MTHCRLCGRDNATHASPSGRDGEVYCDVCCIARCGMHRIEDFVFDERIGIYVDPCVAQWRPERPLREHWQVVK